MNNLMPLTSEINSFADWAWLLSTDDDTLFSDTRVTVRFYGSKEGVYLVLELQPDPTQDSVLEFVFHPLTEEDRQLTLFTMLSKLNYSLVKLIDLVTQGEYEHRDSNEILTFEGVEICRYHVTAN